MRLHRFYVNKPLGEEIVVERAGEEKELFHQWTRVFRYRDGDEVILFSPSSKGTDTIYRFSSLSKDSATLVRVSSSPNILSSGNALVMALVKKDTFETAVRQATELGISRIIPLLAARSEKKGLNFERLSTIAKEAAEQSGRGDLPEIIPVCTMEEAFSRSSGTLIVGSLHGEPLASQTAPWMLWVGPEGGWTDEEEALFKEKGFTFFTCAPTTLKADTALVVLVAKLS